MKIVFIADFFREDLLGGAESNDTVLIEYLESRDCIVEKITCIDFNDNYLNKDNFFIVSNFISLKEKYKSKLQKEKYLIYEHDHKYVISRDPSVYKDFNIPKEDIINHDFYKNAIAVVVLSEICKEILQKTLQIDNVFSIGCSLWSDDRLDYINTLIGEEKNKKYAILQSSNPVKNTARAMAFCNKNNIEFDLIKPCGEEELLKQLAKYEGLVFIPGVLETFSRISAEAKMLNCKLATNPRLLGFGSEEIFNMTGESLIEEIRKRKNKALQLFGELIENDIARSTSTEDITVILNCYRRPQYLEEQIAAIRSQTKKPVQIWLWINYHEDNKYFDFSQLSVDRVINNNYNWKYYGRFAAAMLADTEYVALFDDDTIPGKKWFESCLATMKLTPGILGGAGVAVEGDQYRKHARYGWSSQNEETVEVDLVGHAWFFKQDWVKYLWMEKPYTWDNGEDIQFSYCCQKYGNVQTYCPPHPKEDVEVFSSLKGYEYGVDDKASSNSRNHTVFYQQRDACVSNAIDNGWKTVEMRKK